MEKVNEVGRFKKRNYNYVYSFDDECFGVDLSFIKSHRYDYVIFKEDLLMFLKYVGYLAIPELGIKKYRVKSVKNGEQLRRVCLTVNGKKKDVDNVDIMLKRLRVELNKNKDN